MRNFFAGACKLGLHDVTKFFGPSNSKATIAGIERDCLLFGEQNSVRGKKLECSHQKLRLPLFNLDLDNMLGKSDANNAELSGLHSNAAYHAM